MKLIEFQKIAEMLSKEHKISIESGRNWSANIKEKRLFYRKEDIYSLPEDHILGLLLHEIAHIHYTENVAIPGDNSELTHTTLNVLEDISVEKIISKDYLNAEEILKTTKEELIDTLVNMLPKMENISLHEKSLLYASAKFEGRGYKKGIEIYETIGEEISEIMIKRKKEIEERNRTRDLMPLVKEIVNLLIKKLGEPTEEEKLRMKINSQKENNAGKEDQEKETKQQIIDGIKRGKGWKGNTNIAQDINFIDEIADQAKTIGKKLRKILKRNNAMEFGGRYRTGKLMTKKLSRIKILKDRKPFSRRIIKSNKSYAFAIASDVSGSMINADIKNPASYALSSMYMTGEALRYASVERTLIIFGQNPKMIKELGKEEITWDEIANQKGMRIANQSGTRIGRAINACREELKKSKAERKIMIILTDGGSSITEMKEEHKKAKKENIECLGITIGSDWSGAKKIMDETFSKSKNISINDKKNTKEIGEAFIKILETSITESR